MPIQPLAVWCGFECTIVRVGDAYRDQSVETGHAKRLDDLDRIAALGFTGVRTPVLWERVAPDRTDDRHWADSDRRLGRLRELGLDIIAGLVHHGSGPRHTNLLSESFVPGLVRHAGEVAARYPWIDTFTPVNEPLTTARFACLYGHWYPHRRDSASLFRAVVNQCRATVEAMRAIRRIRPDAKLVQTEDLGRVFGTPEVADQVAYENERRWLSLDLLMGRIDRRHAFRRELVAHGIGEYELDWFVGNPCPPDIIGINHYLSSDRFLDTRIERYAPHEVGGNGRQHYADVAASMTPDVPADEIGWYPRLAEAWDRYRRPLALTEVHNGCTREEQIRWVAEAVEATQRLRSEAVDIRAITAWSVAGAMDWRSLLTRRDGFYESGLFDAGRTPVRKTALASAWQRVTAGEPLRFPTEGVGWWRRNRPMALGQPAIVRPKSVVLVGSGRLVTAFTRIAARRGLDTVVLPASDAMLPDLRDHLQMLAPSSWGVIDAVRRSPGARLGLAEIAGRHDLAHATFSDHRVFDGQSGRPYREDDSRSPACGPGRRLGTLEERILGQAPSSLVVRTSAPFGPWPGCDLSLPAGEEVAPTYLPDLADRVLDLLMDGASGIWHITGATPAAGHLRTQRETPTSRVLVSEQGGTLGPLEEARVRCEFERRR